MRYSSRSQKGTSRPLRPERVQGNQELIDAPRLGRRLRQVRHGLGSRFHRRHGESFLPEIVAQREDPAGHRRWRLPRRWQHHRRELDAHRSPVLQSGDRVSLQEAEPGRPDLQHAAHSVDRHHLRRRWRDGPREHGEQRDDSPPGRYYHRIPTPRMRRPIVKTALTSSVFSGKPTTKNVGPAWNPTPVDTRTFRSAPASQTEPTSRKSETPV